MIFFFPALHNKTFL